MKSDTTRSTFKPEKHYSSVRLQQGRVQTDADWNEQADIQNHALRTHGKTVIGPTGVPRNSDGFALSVNATETDIEIKSGRIYVEGILCQNEQTIAFSSQEENPGTTLPAADGVYAIYLETWERNITALEDPRLREVALGGPDTATRARVITQVKHLSHARLSALEQEKNLSLIRNQFQEIMTRRTGRLQARALPETDTGEPCEPGARGGYNGMENLLYRVEIHQSGDISNATFKWSRLNGSLVSEWISQSAESLTVADAGKDESRRFIPGKWVELLDEHRVLRGEPGTMARILEVRGDSLIIDTTSLAAADYDIENFAGGKRFIRQWDMDDVTGPRKLRDMINAANWLTLESGVELYFTTQSGETFRSGDYWLIPARVATRNIEWPCESGGQPVALIPHGIDRSYCLLGLLTIQTGTWSVRDMRAKFDGLLYQRPVPPESTSVSPDIVHMVNEVEVSTNEPRYDLLEGVETVQDMLDHLFTEKVNRSGDTITGNLRIDQHLEVKGDLIVQGDTISRSNITQPGDVFLGDSEGDEVIIHGMVRAASGQTDPSLHITDSVHITENLLVDGTMLSSSPESTYLAHFKGAGDFSVDASTLTDGRFVVKSDGNVGIGIPAPAARLDVQGGDIKTSGNLFWNNGSSSLRTDETGAIILGDASEAGARPYIEYNFNDGITSHNVRLSAGAGDNLSVLGGSLGVGTDDPATLLHVAGDTKIDGSLGIGTDATAKLHVAGDVKIIGENPVELGADVAGKDSMAGKIGYQLTTPTALDIYGAGTNAIDTRRIKFWNEGGAMFTGPLQIGDDTNPVDLDVSGDMRVEGNGTIGLTTAPTSLTVNGTLSVSGNSRIGATGAPANLDVFGHTSIGEFSAPTSLNVIGTLSATGHTNIGATTDPATLYVSGDTNIGDTLAGADLSVYGQVNITEQTAIGTTTTPADLHVAGNVGIGTTTPGAKLHVAGSAKIDDRNFLEFGAGIVEKEPDAGKIGYGMLTFDPITGDPLALDIVGAGITTAERRIKFWNEGGAVFVGPFQIGDSTSPADLDVSGNLRVAGLAEVGTTMAPTSLTVNGILGVTGDVAVGESGVPADLMVYGQAVIGEATNPTNLTLYGELDLSGNLTSQGLLNAGAYPIQTADINSYSAEIGGPSPDANNGQATLLLHHHGTIAHQLRYTEGTLYLEAAGSGYATSSTPHLVVGGNLSTLGNLGIGTETPSEAIHLVDSRLLIEREVAGYQGHALELRRNYNGVFDGTALTIDTGMGSGLVNITGGAVIDPADGRRYTYLGTRGASRIALLDGAMEFFLGDTTGTEGEEVVWKPTLRIDTAGNVGVGTRTPGATMDVAGTLNVSGNSSFGGDITLASGTTLDGRDISADGATLDSLQTTVVTGEDNWNTAYNERRQWDGGATGLVPATGRASLGLGDMALQNSADYYLKTETDDFFEGENATSGKKQVDWTNILNKPVDLANNWMVTGTDLHYDAGNVGIGTTTPTSPLDVAGNVNITGNITLDVTSTVDGRDISADGITLDSLQATVAAGKDNWNTAFDERNQWDGGATGLVPATGRASLGLGDMALASTTDYYLKTETDDFFEGENSTSGKKQVDWTNILNKPVDLANNWMVTGTDLHYDAGNVGIGTTTPTSPLDVTGNVNITGNITLDVTSTVDGRDISADGDTLDSLQSTVVTGESNWNTAFDERNQWDGGATGLDAVAGRTALGLGDMALASTTDYYLKTETDDFFEGENATSGKKQVDWTNILNKPVDLANNWMVTGTDLHYDAGNVGIGTTTPTSPLDVTGNVNITGNITLDVTSTVDGRDISADGDTLDSLQATMAAGESNWNTAFDERNQWDGGATGLDAVAGRTALGLGDMALASTNDYYLKTETDDFFEGENATSGKKQVDWTNILNKPVDLANNWMVTGSDLHYDAGNVGIGTTTPTSPLDVTGNVNITGNITLDVTSTVDGRDISADGDTLDSLQATMAAGESNWNTAFDERNQWDGGATGLDAVAGRTALGLSDMALASTTDYYLKTEVYARSETYSQTDINSALDLKADLTGATFTGSVQATSFIGDGAGLTNVSADWANISNKPLTFPSDWNDITNKPATYPGVWGVTTGNNIVFDEGNSGLNVGIGTSADSEPTARLEVGGDTRIDGNLSVGSYGVVINDLGEWVGPAISSDLTLKTNVENLKDSLKTILSIQGVGFHWKDEKRGKGRQIGVIAQDVEKVLPQLVEEIGTGDQKHKTVDYTSFIPLLIEAIKEQQKEIERLRGDVMDHFSKSKLI